MTYLRIFNIVALYNYIEDDEMQPKISPLVSEIRAASRILVREFGLMNRTVAGTDLSVSAVHAIIEIGKADGLSSKDLCDKLLLEKSTVSRLVKSLSDRQEISELRSKDDTRVKYLYLTRQGRKTLRGIDNYAEEQVSIALSRLDDRSQSRVLKGLQDYSAALTETSSIHDSTRPIDRVKINAGYVPAIIGRTVEMLHTHMNKHYGFGANFESRIAGDIAEFISRIDAPQNEIWRAETCGKIVASISIDGEDLDDGLAHLRWFVVSSEIRSGGVGRALLSKALDFCDKHGFQETHLWTVKGLEAARKLYESHGFILAEEYNGDQWGTKVVEQKFVRPRFG